jgi:hypothetical protein
MGSKAPSPQIIQPTAAPPPPPDPAPIEADKRVADSAEKARARAQARASASNAILTSPLGITQQAATGKLKLGI